MLRPVLSIFLSVSCLCIASVSSLRAICHLKCIHNFLKMENFQYNSCMKTCFKESQQKWPIKNESGCGMSVDHGSSTPSCSGSNIHANGSSYFISNSEKNREYVTVSWSPCPYGIDDVKGYEIILLERKILGLQICKQVHLNKALDPDYIINNTLSVFFTEQELEFDTSYRIFIEGLPKSRYRHQAFADYTSMSCAELNGVGSCRCGIQGLDKLTAPEAVMSGYHVIASILMLDSCFQVYGYELLLMHSADTVSILQTADFTSNDNSSTLQTVFYPVYLSSDDSQLFLQYHAFSKTGNAVSELKRISIVEWKPSINYVYADKKQIYVSWICPMKHYNISEYEIRLNWYGLTNSNIIRHSTVHVVNAYCSNDDMNVTRSIHYVKVGVYSVQLREYRNQSLYFTKAKWSKIFSNVTITMEAEKPFSRGNVLNILLVVLCPLALIALIGIFLVYCTRKGYCYKIRTNLPFSTGNLLTVTSSFQHKKKSVWIVWQKISDHSAVQELLAENIRHFATYLSTYCSLDVILDQFEVSSMHSYSSWIQQKNSEADVVLFICPYFSCANLASITGNFQAVFKFYEPILLEEGDTGKFVTVIFPYCQTNVSDEVKFLLRTTPVFKLMDQMEDLYFFIQNCSKVSHLGRLSVKYIHKCEYAETNEGNALKRGIEKIQKLKLGETTAVDTLRNHSIYPKHENVLHVLPPKSFTEDTITRPILFKLNPPPPVLDDEDADKFVFLINTHQLLSLRLPSNDAYVEPVTCETLCSSNMQVPYLE